MKRVPSLPEVRVRRHDPVVLGEVLELDRPGGLYHRVRQGDLGEGVRTAAAGLRMPGRLGWKRRRRTLVPLAGKYQLCGPGSSLQLVRFPMAVTVRTVAAAVASTGGPYQEALLLAS